jgi:hypothetical protein
MDTHCHADDRKHLTEHFVFQRSTLSYFTSFSMTLAIYDSEEQKS